MGGTLVLMPSFDPVDLLNLIQREKCTHVFMVPTQFIKTMEHPEFHRYDTSSVEILLSAAAPLRKSTKNEILQKFPNSRLVELYGITEGISTVLRPNEQFAKLGSVGKPRLGGDIKIINDQGEELPRGEVGEIVGFNFSMMREYSNNPDATKNVAWYDKSGRCYVKTGDIGKLDADGYLYILDRKKDMIVSGGINIYPSDIEDVILRHPDVSEAAVIGVPHREWGESPFALVVKKPACELDADALRDWINGKLAPYQKLLALEFRQFLPKNDLGKILKSELREPYWKAFET
jgi:acyl-CoA synthetase (AMP-forming)/AMP-acid ligase II